MNQKDPNNISGLLKMHLRENNLLSERSVQSIGKVLGQGMVSGLARDYRTRANCTVVVESFVEFLVHASATCKPLPPNLDILELTDVCLFVCPFRMRYWMLSSTNSQPWSCRCLPT